MNNDVRVTVAGYVAGEPQLRQREGDRWLSFRLASTPWYRDASGEYQNGTTQWFQVKVNRDTAAVNIHRSITRGTPVIVVGRLSTHEWSDQQGQTRFDLQIQADTVGYDFRKGHGRFAKTGEPIALEAPSDQATSTTEATGPTDSTYAPPAGLTDDAEAAVYEYPPEAGADQPQGVTRMAA